jgi:hypothetical protein
MTLDWSGVWFLWLSALFVTFIILEARAINKGGVTLSATVRGWAETWPLLPFAVGIVFGMLGTHFFWPWCPETMQPQCPPCAEVVGYERDRNLQPTVALAGRPGGGGVVLSCAAPVPARPMSAAPVGLRQVQ